MIKLIVGLGNPSQQYVETRHNVGFLFLERMAYELGCVWVKEAKFQALCSRFSVAGHQKILLKPETFMNRSGQSVGAATRYHKINADEVLVVHDELDFEVGKVKLKKSGGHAGHNGLRDIIAHLQTPDFYRLRIGIGRPVTGKSVADYVLSTPSKPDRDLIDVGIYNGLKLVKELIQSDEI